MDIHVFFVSDHIADDITVHVHNFFQLIYCKSGKGILTLSKKEYEAKSGNVYLAAPGVPHSIKNNDRLELIEFKFYTYGKFTDRIAMLPPVFSISEDPFITELLFRTVETAFEKGAFCNSAVDSGVLSFFVSLCGNFSETRDKQHKRVSNYVYLDVAEEETRDADIMILKLRDYIEKHFAEKIMLDDLAKKVHFNKTYFVKRFESFFGMPPMKYVNNVRLEKAEKLLAFSDTPIKTIAERTGFGSIHYLSRKFKQKYGVSPSGYRAQQKTNDDT